MACTIDFRCLDEGFGGKTYKRKRQQQDASAASFSSEHVEDMDVEGASQPSKRQAVASSEDPDKPAVFPLGKPTYDGVIAGKVSGRNWKQARTHRASSANVSRKKTTLELRKKEKEIKRAYQERMKELKDEIKQNKMEKRKKREEREKRKKENILRSGTKLQKITNPKTLKKIAKSAKQRKMLKVVSDDVLQGNPNPTKKKKLSAVV